MVADCYIDKFCVPERVVAAGLAPALDSIGHT